MRFTSVALALLMAGCASKPLPTFPAPRVTGTIVTGDDPASGADLLICFISNAGACIGAEARTRTDAGGHFQFARGSWGQVASYEVLGPLWHLALVQAGQPRVVFTGPLIGDPSNTWIGVSCDLSAEPDEACEVVWAGGQ